MSIVMDPSENILERISTQFAKLSPSARDIANYIQQNPLTLLSMSVSELASATQTSKATVSRLFRQLGYASHLQAKQSLIASRDKGFPVASVYMTDQHHLDCELQNIQQSFKDLSSQYTSELGTTIANAKRVYIIGFRNAYPLALHFRQQLMQIRQDVVLLPQPGQTLGEDVVDIGLHDVVILLGFRRRPTGFEHLINALKGKQTILITDPTGQVFHQDVKHLLLCYLGGQDTFDSYAAAMSLIALLCNKTEQALPAKNRGKAAKISACYTQLNELSKL